MKHSTQVALMQKVLDLLESGTTDMAESTFMRPVEDYYDTGRLAREQQMIFHRSPLMIAHSSQLSDPGDFVTQTLAGRPVVVIRDENGRLNAFLNICRHRGTKVTLEECGKNRKAFVCPYHGWTYDRSGRLIHITDEVGFPDVDKNDYGLVPLPVAEKHGFVWVALAQDTPLDMDAFLGPLAEDFASFAFQSHSTYRPYTLKKAINWKLAFDIFLEGYHVKYAHTKTIYPFFFNNVGVYERFYPHLRNLFPKRSIRELAGTDPHYWDIREHANILYYIFPNVLLLIQPDHASLFRIFPEGTDSSVAHVVTLVPTEPVTEKARNYWDKNIRILFSATEEDFTMGELMQEGLRAGANTHLKFGRYEQALAYFHSTIDDALQAPIMAM